MPTVDLTTPTREPSGLLDGLPRRVALTLPELRAAAARAGGAPLPFDVSEPRAGALEGRLGRSPGSTEDAAYLHALESLHDPEDSLARRGLLTGDGDGGLDAGLAGAIGLLATPAVALDLDVRAGFVQGKAWHREAAGAVATLATVDGVVFELAWFDSPQWPAELARTAVLPEDLATAASDVPERLDLPFELASAVTDAVRTQRSDLVPVLVAHHSGQVRDADGRPLPDAEAEQALTALCTEPRGRLRGLVTDVADGGGSVVGVVSWVLVADGWRALRPRRVDGDARVEVQRVEPPDLAADLAPVLAEVTS